MINNAYTHYPTLLISVVDSFYVSLIKSRVILEAGTSVTKMPLPDWPVVKSVGHFLDDYMKDYYRLPLYYCGVPTLDR